VHILSVTDFGIPREIARANLYAPSWNPGVLIERVARLPGVASARRVGVDGLTPLFETLLTSALRDAQLVDGESVMRAARRIKTPDEVALMRAAAAVAGTTMAAALDAVAAGLDEVAVKAIAMEAMANAGVTTAAFEPVLDRNGSRVSVAIGVLRGGWEADVTRSRPDVRNWAIDRCGPGIRVAELGADVHGVGLGYEVLAPDDVLEAGMVVSVGSPGVRDTVVITERGAPEVLTAVRV
jgi:Xaa-Pro aminopeptidase